MKYLAMTTVAMAMAIATPVTAQSNAKDDDVRLWRLDCGTITIKEFNSFFSDTLDYKPGSRDVAASCYLIQRKGEYLLWDTGYPASAKGPPSDKGYGIVIVRKTVAEQLAELGLKATDISVVGISHMHGDHVGQAREFPGAKLVVGKGDFELTRGNNDPFAPWRAQGAKVQTMHGSDIDIFGDGKVIALNLPGHTPDHMALLVKLKSGNVLLTGDMYHSTEAREVRGVPPFNTNRAETLASMDRFERLANNLDAKVIIQHEPADISKLPAFPKAAE
jgi:glyoxylase-like metal-dependent hydrolase (beta-lactamase superfamily II)